MMLTLLASLAVLVSPAPCDGLRLDEALDGLDARVDVDAARVIIVGEVHGYTAAPCMVEAIARSLIADGRPLAFGFEDNRNSDAQRARITEHLAAGEIDAALAQAAAPPEWATTLFQA